MSGLDRVSRRPSWLLSRANARAQALLADSFTAAGVRGYHFRVLAALDQYGPSSQADLGRRTGIDESEVVATVKDLVARGSVTTERDPSDRRRNIVTITREGLEALERLEVAVAAVQEDILAPLSASEQRTFLRLLEKLSHGQV